MRIEWDPAKNETNKTKHGIGFETAMLGFDDPCCLNFVERIVGGEDRWHAVGAIEGIIVVVVVHTYHQNGAEEVVRIISARCATRRERRIYAEAIG